MIEFTPEQRAVRQWLSKPAPCSGACGCMGPREGEPRCPCDMKYVEKVDGKWYEIKEHRSPDGITHTALYIGDVNAAPEDPFITECREILKVYGRLTAILNYRKHGKGLVTMADAVAFIDQLINEQCEKSERQHDKR